MNMYDIIEKKRDGGKLSRDEIYYFVNGFTKGEIPDYQASALLMAIFIRKMDKEETYILTEAMEHSGDIVDLSDVKGVKVDKHSTGGVGDKTTLICAPLAASCGVTVAKMSGRGLGFTGGTIDKLESIPGFQTQLSPEKFRELLNRNGIAITGQTAEVAKADKLIYALRDVTATVDDISLITSSVMSKKLASGSDAIVLDVKCGDGAFMHDIESARRMADLMVEMGRKAGKKTIALITSMEQPLGNAVGNALEVKEAIETLKGDGPRDITDLSVEIAGAMIFAAGICADLSEGRVMAEDALASGRGLEKFRTMIKAQGGDERVAEDTGILPAAKEKKTVTAEKAGFVQAVHAKRIGAASVHTGAGRAKKDDIPDPGAGMMLRKKTGDRVERGEVLAEVFACSSERAENAAAEVFAAYEIGDEPCSRPELLLDDVLHPESDECQGYF